MASRFRLQIVDIDTGEIVVGNIHPGRESVYGAFGELDLVERVVTRAQAKGVGALRSEAHTLDAFRDAMIRTFQDTKDRVS